MLGHGLYDDDITYPIQTLKDNIALLTSEVLDRINQVVEEAGHKQLPKKKSQEKKIEKAYQNYLSEVEYQLARVRETLEKLENSETDFVKPIFVIRQYFTHAERQLDQLRRRVIAGETIAHEQKVFSIFEPHTEWIVKGKAVVSQELGLPVCILEDQYGFILNHRVMQHEKDLAIAVSFTRETVEKFPELSGCSYDKGFYSPQNREDLEQILEKVILPKKGRLSAQDREREHSDSFRQLRRRHSAVESAINALENHGLDRCPDHGIVAFKRYVSLAVAARNLQKLGNILLQKDQKTKRRKAA